ncbi:MAG: CBS domain-containing protein [Ferruginibacter sp.]|nr:CBS domain-containing protein [Ferruginibacter sp.]
MDNRLAFLQSVVPFNLLPDDVLVNTAALLIEAAFHKDGIIYRQGISKLKGVDIIVEGEYETFFYDSSHNKRLIEIYHTGDCYGGITELLVQKKSLRTVFVKKGTRVYTLPRKAFNDLCQAHEEFFQHFTHSFGQKMLNEEYAHFYKNPTNFERSFITSEQLYSRRIESMEYRDIVWCGADTPVYQAAIIMGRQKISCLFVKDKQGKIIGFVTDITIRDNVVAKQAAYERPVSSIMDNPVAAINVHAFVYEAILSMFRTNMRYLLIEKDGEYIGLISRNKLLSEQGQSPLVFIQSVKQAISIDELKRKWETVPQIVAQLLERGVHAAIVNQVITAVSDTIAIKVIESVTKEMGSSPAKFVFMVLGSEGRKEQTLKTDQDNAIIYEDKANEHREEVREYFLKFASQVSDHLNTIGFSYCTGGFMAQNPKWTHSLSHWKKNYVSWMNESVPETVMQISTFFDCRYIYGDETIIKELEVFLSEQLQNPMERLFHFMAKNALQYEPPLTPFFKNIRTFKVDKKEVFDIKKAMTPIVDLVRVYALKNLIFESNTGERLKALKDKQVFTDIEVTELLQSYYYLMGLRLKTQSQQIIQDHLPPDNYIMPQQLSKIDQLTLKEIFKTIENFQLRIRMQFTGNLLG